jgi:predicted SAM-dependent methyltransferase
MKIQITPIKKVEDALVIWHEKTPDVDIVIDSRAGLNMKGGSVKTIYAFDLLGISQPQQILPILQNLYDILAPNGEIYISETDFDYINRSYIGGDLTLDELNRKFRRQTYVNQHELVKILDHIGFPEKDQRLWFENLQFKKEHYEIIISGKKPNIQ